MRKSNFLIVMLVMASIVSIYVPTVTAARYLPFTVGDNDTPQNVDPANAYDSVSYDTLNQVYEGLYTYNLASPDMESIPMLAAEMGVWDSTNTNLTIELREDVLFHDGSTFNASDVVWNFDRINYFALNEMSDPYTLYLNDEGDLILNRTEIIDEFTVMFVLNKPFAVWEKMLAFTGSSIIKPNAAFAEDFLTLSDAAVGTGPFKLVEIEPDLSVTFERFEDYYKGPANITSMVYTIIADGEVASTAMLNHELHYGGVISEHLDEAEADPEITIERVKTTVVFYLQLCVLNIPYEVRRALAFGWNYTYYLEETLKGEAYELHTPIPAGMQYNNESIEGLPYFNRTIARDYMLNCANITDVHGLNETSSDQDWIDVTESTPLWTANFTRYTSVGLEKILTQLVDNMAYIGIEIGDHHVGDWGTWTEWSQIEDNKKSMDISMGGWGPDYNDAINMIEPIYKTNATYNTPFLADPVLDQMMSDNYALTGINRSKSFDDIVYRLIVVNAPCFYIYQRGGREVYNNLYVSNIDEMLNAFDNTYWYNVIYSPQEAPGIPGYTLGYTLIACLGAVGLIAFAIKKRH